VRQNKGQRQSDPARSRRRFPSRGNTKLGVVTGERGCKGKVGVYGQGGYLLLCKEMTGGGS